MKVAVLSRGYIFGGAAILCFAFALFLHFMWGQSDPNALSKRLENELNADFQTYVAENLSESEKIISSYAAEKALKPAEGVVRLVLDNDCQLVDWNDSELMPSPLIIKDICNYPNRRTLRDKNKIFYYFRQDAAAFKLVTLLPILADYKVDNSLLPRRLFLGRYANEAAVRDVSNQIDVYLRQVEGGIRVFDSSGNFVYCLNIPDLLVFVQQTRIKVFYSLLLGIIFLIVSIFQAFGSRRTRIGKLSFSGLWIPILMLVGLRVIAFSLGFPGNYLQSAYFSPTILAIGAYAPSLGDLLINVALYLVVTWLLIKHYRRKISILYRNALKNEFRAWILQCIVLTLSSIITWAFFQFIAEVIAHSTINFEFENVFQLDKYSYIAFLMIGAVLVGWQLIILELLRFSFHFFKGNGRWTKVVLSVIWLTGLSFVLFGIDAAYVFTVPFVFGLSLLIFLRTQKTVVFKLDLPNFLLVIFMFSLLSMIGVVKGNDLRQDNLMQMVADRQSNEHDLITEFVFERVVGEVEAEAFLLDYTDVNGIAKRLKEQFFESSFKGYEVRIFIYGDSSNLLDKTGDYRPYLFPSSDPSLEQMGTTTMTEDLYLVKYYKGLFENIYIGKFPLLLRSLGKMLVWVELLPTEISPNRLYPQLLLDDHVRNKALLANEFDYAVYKDGRLFRKHSVDPFPIFYNGPDLSNAGSFVYAEENQYQNLYDEVGNGKIVNVRRPELGAFDIVNVFSYIFYFFILAAILLMLPFWIIELFQKPFSFRDLSLKARIQAFFLCLSVLPLFIVVFVLAPYIREHIFRDIRNDLQAQTQQIAGFVREDYLKLRRYSTSYSAQHGSLLSNLRETLDDRLATIEKTFGNDINIYYSNGKLHLTTQPSIFELGLTSRYMNPEVYQAIRTGAISDIVIEDKIGNVTYFSGFYPIMSDDRKIVGFLNIPFYKNQEKVNAQSLSLLTLLVNIYVFIFLAIGIVAVIISNSIIRPLALLSDKLNATMLGKRNEPIEWSSKDEIGEIIEAYNQMLSKLEESEEKLARSQREMAWQEMARQVAHEIKNPLTPMRLSVQHLVRNWNDQKPENTKLNTLFEKVTRTILVQIESLVNIANSFSQFANMPEPQRSKFELQRVIQEVEDLYASDEMIQFELEMPQADFIVNADRDQLSRVFNNLVKNAKQAIEHEEGKISIKMLVEGEMAKVEIKDNGKGIPEEIGARIFEPRFSTKSSGMGLGLAIVKKIIESAGGKIYFESEVGKGSSFFVELPRSRD